LKKRAGHKQRARRDWLKFSRYLFWVSWIWVLLFAVGELLEAVKTEGYGDKLFSAWSLYLRLAAADSFLEHTLKALT
jgi:hypothetical protein